MGSRLWGWSSSPQQDSTRGFLPGPGRARNPRGHPQPLVCAVSPALIRGREPERPYYAFPLVMKRSPVLFHPQGQAQLPTRPARQGPRCSRDESAPSIRVSPGRSPAAPHPAGPAGKTAQASPGPAILPTIVVHAAPRWLETSPWAEGVYIGSDCFWKEGVGGRGSSSCRRQAGCSSLNTFSFYFYLHLFYAESIPGPCVFVSSGISFSSGAICSPWVSSGSLGGRAQEGAGGLLLAGRAAWGAHPAGSLA